MAFEGGVYLADVAVNGDGETGIAFGAVDGFNTVDGVKYVTDVGGDWVVSVVHGVVDGDRVGERVDWDALPKPPLVTRSTIDDRRRARGRRPGAAPAAAGA